ncbi:MULTISPECIES: hypothetical protein [Streptomyces]|uniref:Helix-turn-helix domain-containing protein n=1 Tax=Streptomyces glycanivorans TaxID=3033808 RepID=A0ABY9JB63_9ACTN|nr:hypothetical protein [Streptomyces sp. Alt3]WLQ64898.1 hypothetical protein P8A20_15410 [Streptomyces sp. Alt3]
MLRHAIAPSRRYTKASHDVVRHSRLTSDAKILLLAVQGLPEEMAARPLGEHARKLGITGRAYQKSKEQLVAHGYVHEWRDQGERGRWVTEQLLSNVPLTPEEASALRHGRTEQPPSARKPTVGDPAGRVAGRQLPVGEEQEKNCPHPPSEARPEDRPEGRPEVRPEVGLQVALGPEAAEGERVLLSLRHVRRELYLGVKEARGLAELAGRWLLRGVSAGELRRVLTSELPGDGVRSAVGFLRFRLLHKMPPELPAAPSPEPAATPPRVAELVACTVVGPEGDVHVFRPLSDETECGPCRRRAAWERWEERKHLAEAEPEPLPWRERFAKLGASCPGDEGAVHRA